VAVFMMGLISEQITALSYREKIVSVRAIAAVLEARLDRKPQNA
jgi:hypothetical protein